MPASSTGTRPPALDVSSGSPSKSQQEREDEDFVHGVLNLSLHSSRGGTHQTVKSKYGSLVSPTGDLEDTKYIRTGFGAHVRLPHHTSASAEGVSATEVRPRQSAVALLQNMKRSRGRIHHQWHADVAHQEQQAFEKMEVTQKEREERRQLEKCHEAEILRQGQNANEEETASVASFGTIISHASTRVVKEPLRPSWRPLRASKSTGNRRVQGAGLLHVVGRIAKEQVNTSLRDTYQEPHQHTNQMSRRSSSSGYGVLCGGYPRGNRLDKPVKKSSERGVRVDDAKELRRAFKLQLHTLPAIDRVEGFGKGFETAALFQKPSRPTEPERQAMFASLAKLHQAADDHILRQHEETCGGNGDRDGEDRMTACEEIGEEIQARLDRLGTLRDRAAILLNQ